MRPFKVCSPLHHTMVFVRSLGFPVSTKLQLNLHGTDKRPPTESYNIMKSSRPFGFHGHFNIGAEDRSIHYMNSFIEKYRTTQRHRQDECVGTVTKKAENSCNVFCTVWTLSNLNYPPPHGRYNVRPFRLTDAEKKCTRWRLVSMVLLIWLFYVLLIYNWIFNVGVAISIAQNDTILSKRRWEAQNTGTSAGRGNTTPRLTVDFVLHIILEYTLGHIHLTLIHFTMRTCVSTWVSTGEVDPDRNC
jgi:hypothetical protein